MTMFCQLKIMHRRKNDNRRMHGRKEFIGAMNTAQSKIGEVSDIKIGRNILLHPIPKLQQEYADSAALRFRSYD